MGRTDFQLKIRGYRIEPGEIDAALTGHAQVDQSVTVPATPPARMIWPVHGKIVSKYGTSGGQKNDGIDIAAAKGATVKAAESGKVVYAGNEVAKMGNLLLVEHSGGYITAYGNNESLLVKKGDTVKKGQAIAKVGDRKSVV